MGQSRRPIKYDQSLFYAWGICETPTSARRPLRYIDVLKKEKYTRANTRTSLHAIWAELGASDCAALAEQHGALMAALHALPLEDSPADLAFDWSALLGAQRTECVIEMRRAGVADALVRQVEPYLEATPWGDDPPVLVHGDLTHLNLLVAEQGDGWRITGLIDWGDVKLGSRTHEFISPGVHCQERWYKS